MSELLWVAVPGGQATPDGDAVLRLLIVPRLTGRRVERLDEHLGNWPDTLGTVDDLRVELSSGPEAAITTLSASRPGDADRDLWDACFGPATSVASFELPVVDEPVVDPTAVHAEKVIDTYTASAVAEAHAVAARGA